MRPRARFSEAQAVKEAPAVMLRTSPVCTWAKVFFLVQNKELTLHTLVWRVLLLRVLALVTRFCVQLLKREATSFSSSNSVNTKPTSTPRASLLEETAVGQATQCRYTSFLQTSSRFADQQGLQQLTDGEIDNALCRSSSKRASNDGFRTWRSSVAARGARVRPASATTPSGQLAMLPCLEAHFSWAQPQSVGPWCLARYRGEPCPSSSAEYGGAHAPVRFDV